MNDKRDIENVRWYKVSMMWMVVAIPLASVLGGIAMITLAINNDDGLVADDYYKDGMEINRVLDRDRKAYDMGLKAQYQLHPGAIEVRLFSAPGTEIGGNPELKLLNATRQGLDREVQLHKNAGGQYVASMAQLPVGRWYITLETPSWRLTGVLKIPGADAGMLVPVGD